MEIYKSLISLENTLLQYVDRKYTPILEKGFYQEKGSILYRQITHILSNSSEKFPQLQQKFSYIKAAFVVNLIILPIVGIIHNLLKLTQIISKLTEKKIEKQKKNYTFLLFFCALVGTLSIVAHIRGNFGDGLYRSSEKKVSRPSCGKWDKVSSLMSTLNIIQSSGKNPSPFFVNLVLSNMFTSWAECD